MSWLPSLIALKSFEAAARHRNLSRAADELGVHPTALSHQLRRLEQDLGVKLFRRDRYGIVLTDIGEKLSISLGVGFKWIRSGVDSAREKRKKQPAILKISALPLYSVRFLIPRLRSFHESHPDIRVQVTTTLNMKAREDEADALIDWTNPAECSPRQCEVILQDKAVPVASPSLVRKLGQPQHDRDVLRFPLLQDQPLPNEWMYWCEFGGLPFRPNKRSMIVLDTNALLAMTLTGEGASIMRVGMIFEYLELGLLKIISRRIHNDGRAYCLVTNSTQRSTELKVFREWLVGISVAETERIRAIAL